MSKLNNNTRAAIDALSKDELRCEVNLGQASRFQHESFAYVQTRLKQLEEQEVAERHQQALEYQDKQVELAQEANDISRSANRRSVIAILISIASLLLVAYVTLFCR